MSVRTHVSSFTMTTAVATSTITVAKTGFAPIAVIFWWCGQPFFSGGAAASLRRGYGFAVAGANRCAFSSELTAATVGESDRGIRNDAAIATILPGTADPQALEGRASVALTSQGFIVTIDDAFATAFTVQYMAIGGDEFISAAVGDFTAPTSAATDSVVALSFDPKVVFTAMVGSAVAMNAVGVDSVLAFGACSAPLADDAAQQWVHCSWSDDGPTTTDTWKYMRSGENIASSSGTTGLNFRGSITSLTGGFIQDWLEVDGVNQPPVIYLALGGDGRVQVGNFLTRADTNTLSIPCVGRPLAVLVVSADAPECAADTPVAQDELSIGAFSFQVNCVNNCYSQSRTALGTSACLSLTQEDVVTFAPFYQNYSTAGVIGSDLGTTLNFSDFGFSCSPTVADDAANFVGFVAFMPQHDLTALSKGGQPDHLGFIYKGDLLVYVDFDNVNWVSNLESAVAIYGQSVDLCFLKVSGAVNNGIPLPTKVSVSGIQHSSTAGGPPYWRFLDEH